MANYIVFFFLFITISATAQHTLYLFPGQGSDSAIFSKMNIPDSFTLRYMNLPTPNKGEMLPEYAQRFISEIDTTKPYSLIGVSLGGMICSELAEMLKPEKVIIISSAKCASELPAKYSFQQKVRLNRAIPASWYRRGALLLQPLVEPDRNKEKSTFKHMLRSKDKVYMKRAVDMIINWQKESYKESIIHIHGDKDNTIPIKNVKPTIVIIGGSHMMALTRGEDLGKLIAVQLSS
jgi:pimeloyl-ACP methyl ester carboxylesterase